LFQYQSNLILLINSAAHGLIFNGDYKECSFKIGTNFFKTNLLDNTCLRSLPALDFRGNTDEVQKISNEGKFLYYFIVFGFSGNFLL
jgi:hypothetical protein